MAVAGDVGALLLDALGRRDYVDIAGCFAHDAQLRSVVPPGVREDDGADAIAARFRLWTESLEDYEVVAAEVAPLADLLRVTWAIKGIDAELGLCIFEQTAYAEVEGNRIVRMRLACSGDRPIT
jgi:hypothetical protein